MVIFLEKSGSQSSLRAQLVIANIPVTYKLLVNAPTPTGFIGNWFKSLFRCRHFGG